MGSACSKIRWLFFGLLIITLAILTAFLCLFSGAGPFSQCEQTIIGSSVKAAGLFRESAEST
jgi:hypothetical protein